jgi:hypothetical protein
MSAPLRRSIPTGADRPSHLRRRRPVLTARRSGSAQGRGAGRVPLRLQVPSACAKVSFAAPIRESVGGLRTPAHRQRAHRGYVEASAKDWCQASFAPYDEPCLAPSTRVQTRARRQAARYLESLVSEKVTACTAWQKRCCSGAGKDWVPTRTRIYIAGTGRTHAGRQPPWTRSIPVDAPGRHVRSRRDGAPRHRQLLKSRADGDRGPYAQFPCAGAASKCLASRASSCSGASSGIQWLTPLSTS